MKITRGFTLYPFGAYWLAKWHRGTDKWGMRAPGLIV